MLKRNLTAAALSGRLVTNPFRKCCNNWVSTEIQEQICGWRRNKLLSKALPSKSLGVCVFSVCQELFWVMWLPRKAEFWAKAKSWAWLKYPILYWNRSSINWNQSLLISQYFFSFRGATPCSHLVLYFDDLEELLKTLQGFNQTREPLKVTAVSPAHERNQIQLHQNENSQIDLSWWLPCSQFLL